VSELLFVLLSIGISLAVTSFGFAVARKYVRDRLKFVDAVHTMKAPIIAGLVGWAIAMPFTMLPFIGLGTAIVFGLAVGLGVRAGAKDIKIGRLSGGY
jgi:hypothetical protein